MTGRCPAVQGVISGERRRARRAGRAAYSVLHWGWGWRVGEWGAGAYTVVAVKADEFRSIKLTVVIHGDRRVMVWGLIIVA